MMLTPCCPSAGPTGGAGVAFPAGSCNLTTATTFFMRPPERLLDLLHLGEIQLHGRLPAEDRHQDPDLLLLREDLVHDPGEVHEGPGVDAHRRPLLVGDPELRRLVPELAQDRLHLPILEGERLAPGSDETRDAGRVADDVPGIVVHDHLHQLVPREHLLLGDPPLPVLDLYLVLGGHQDAEDLPLHPHGRHPASSASPSPPWPSGAGGASTRPSTVDGPPAEGGAGDSGAGSPGGATTPTGDSGPAGESRSSSSGTSRNSCWMRAAVSGFWLGGRFRSSGIALHSCGGDGRYGLRIAWNSLAHTRSRAAM